MYSLFAGKDGHAYMILRISEEPTFLDALGKRKIKVMTKDELGLKSRNDPAGIPSGGIFLCPDKPGRRIDLTFKMGYNIRSNT